MIDFGEIIRESARTVKELDTGKESPNDALPATAELLMKYSIALLANYHAALREELKRQGIEI